MKAHEYLLTILGDIKVFKWPFFLIYQPKGYQVIGKEVEDILKFIKPGDILLRGYNDYLDGKFIPGQFSHAACYYGSNRVIHLMAEGVVNDHLIDFCKCDRMVVLRIKNASNEDIEKAKWAAWYFEFKQTKYDFDFDFSNNKLYCSEFVFRIWSHVLKIAPIEKRFMFFFKKEIILPDQFLNHPDIEIVYKTRKVNL